jgi:hypothetical protein
MQLLSTPHERQGDAPGVQPSPKIPFVVEKKLQEFTLALKRR